MNIHPVVEWIERLITSSSCSGMNVSCNSQHSSPSPAVVVEGFRFRRRPRGSHGARQSFLEDDSNGQNSGINSTNSRKCSQSLPNHQSNSTIRLCTDASEKSASPALSQPSSKEVSVYNSTSGESGACSTQTFKIQDICTSRDIGNCLEHDFSLDVLRDASADHAVACDSNTLLGCSGSVSECVEAPSSTVLTKSEPLSERNVFSCAEDIGREKLAAAIPRKRRKFEKAKLYKSLPSDLSEEERFLRLVELIADAELANSRLGNESSITRDIDALEAAVAEVVKIAREYATSSEPVFQRTRPNRVNDDMRRREALLKHVIDQYTSELSEWNALMDDLSSLTAAADVKGTENHDTNSALPPLPPFSDLTGVGSTAQIFTSVKEASDSFILHRDEINYSLKQLEVQQERDARIVETIADTLNANVFGGVLDLSCSKIVASPL